MAQSANEARTTVLSSVSHDIRTPMNAILGFLTLMKDEIDHQEIVPAYIHRIESASQHLLGLINDVLDMNKIESGSTILSVSEMNMADVIEEINAIIRPQAKAKNQSFDNFVSHMKYEQPIGDKMRINQILIKLLSLGRRSSASSGGRQNRHRRRILRWRFLCSRIFIFSSVPQRRCRHKGRGWPCLYCHDKGRPLGG